MEEERLSALKGVEKSIDECLVYMDKTDFRRLSRVEETLGAPADPGEGITKKSVQKTHKDIPLASEEEAP